jgi:hypothetical protein
MFFRSKKKLQQLLSDVRGPSPWFLRDKSASIKTSRGIYTWEESERDKETSGITYLVNPQNNIVLILDMYFYIKPLESEKILVWNVEPDALKGETIHLYMFDLSQMKNIPEGKEYTRNLRPERRRIAFASGLINTCSFSTQLANGNNDIQVPEEIKPCGEILVIANNSQETGKPHYCIFDFDFNNSNVNVLPQDWFNNGNYDYGYQWICRIARIPSNRQIIGDGIRLGRFLLNSKANDVSEWLQKE